VLSRAASSIVTSVSSSLRAATCTVEFAGTDPITTSSLGPVISRTTATNLTAFAQVSDSTIASRRAV
jgi:hypothetical protein